MGKLVYPNRGVNAVTPRMHMFQRQMGYFFTLENSLSKPTIQCAPSDKVRLYTGTHCWSELLQPGMGGGLHCDVDQCENAPER